MDLSSNIQSIKIIVEHISNGIFPKCDNIVLISDLIESPFEIRNREFKSIEPTDNYIILNLN